MAGSQSLTAPSLVPDASCLDVDETTPERLISNHTKSSRCQTQHAMVDKRFFGRHAEIEKQALTFRGDVEAEQMANLRCGVNPSFKHLPREQGVALMSTLDQPLRKSTREAGWYGQS